MNVLDCSNRRRCACPVAAVGSGECARFGKLHITPTLSTSFLNCRLSRGDMYPCSNLGELAIFNVEGARLTASKCPIPGKLIGGGDDERELRGQMPETTQADPPLPLSI